jgi:hypothetical protein
VVLEKRGSSPAQRSGWLGLWGGTKALPWAHVRVQGMVRQSLSSARTSTCSGGLAAAVRRRARMLGRAESESDKSESAQDLAPARGKTNIFPFSDFLFSDFLVRV